MSSRIGVDIGGTFTDFILYDEMLRALLPNNIRNKVCPGINGPPLGFLGITF